MGITYCAVLILCLNHIGELQVYIYFTYYRHFLLFFSFYAFVTLTVIFLFVGASIVCLSNLKRRAGLILCCDSLRGRLYNLMVLKASSNLTKLRD